jgi:hypothetical protein
LWAKKINLLPEALKISENGNLMTLVLASHASDILIENAPPESTKTHIGKRDIDRKRLTNLRTHFA